MIDENQALTMKVGGVVEEFLAVAEPTAGYVLLVIKDGMVGVTTNLVDHHEIGKIVHDTGESMLKHPDDIKNVLRGGQ